MGNILREEMFLFWETEIVSKNKFGWKIPTFFCFIFPSFFADMTRPPLASSILFSLLVFGLLLLPYEVLGDRDGSSRSLEDGGGAIARQQKANEFGGAGGVGVGAPPPVQQDTSEARRSADRVEGPPPATAISAVCHFVTLFGILEAIV
jgi:hypothetical protein